MCTCIYTYNAPLICAMWYKRWKCEHIIFSFSYAHCGIDIVVIVVCIAIAAADAIATLANLTIIGNSTSIFASSSALIYYFFLISLTKMRRQKRIQYCIVNVSCTSIYLYDIANDVDDVELWHTHTISRYAAAALATKRSRTRACACRMQPNHLFSQDVQCCIPKSENERRHTK